MVSPRILNDQNHSILPKSICNPRGGVKSVEVNILVMMLVLLMALMLLGMKSLSFQREFKGTAQTSHHNRLIAANDDGGSIISSTRKSCCTRNFPLIHNE